MGDPGLDPKLALEVMETVLFWIASILGGSVVLGLFLYVALLFSEVFSPRTRPKAPLAKTPLPVGSTPAAEQNQGFIVAGTPIPAEARSLSGEVVPAPAVPYDSQIPKTLAPVNPRERTHEAAGFAIRTSRQQDRQPFPRIGSKADDSVSANGRRYPGRFA